MIDEGGIISYLFIYLLFFFQLGEFKLPVLYKGDKKRSREESRSDEPFELFPSDDEDDNIKFG